MEQKKVQRIIGILVVIALVIIVMPLIFAKSDFPVQEASNVKAPPFSDRTPASPVAANDTQTPVLASADTSVTQASSTVEPLPTSPDKTAAPAKLPEPPLLSTPVQQPVAENKPMDTPPVDAATPPAATPATANTPGSIIYEPVSASAIPDTTTQKPADPAASETMPNTPTTKSPVTIEKNIHTPKPPTKYKHTNINQTSFNKV